MIANDYELILNQQDIELKKMRKQEGRYHHLAMGGLFISEALLCIGMILLGHHPYTIGLFLMTFPLLFIFHRVDEIITKRFEISRRALTLKNAQKLSEILDNQTNLNWSATMTTKG